MSEVRTRFAPSPTGLPHIGGYRTAIYAWLLARHCGGKFILRIEDTDRARLVPGVVRSLIEELAWLGVEIDEGPSRAELCAIGEDWEGAPELGGGAGPYVQSLRLDRYRAVADLLIEKGVAFRCDCTPERLEAERAKQIARKETPGYGGYCRDRSVGADRPHVVRFRMPDYYQLSLPDAVRGVVNWESVPLKDPVLLKSDGFPTYHLAVVVDDHEMRISHVLRGEEWLPSAPLHLLLYEALTWQPPVFAHLPVVLGADGKKLSKRHGATSLSAFKDQGFLAQALFNYLPLIGWSPGDGSDQEVFTKQEMVERFSLQNVSSAGGVFDYAKLTWMNGLYLRRMPIAELTPLVKAEIEKHGLTFDENRWLVIAPHVRERLKVLPDVVPVVSFLFAEQLERDLDQIVKKDFSAPLAAEVLLAVAERLSGVPEFDKPSIEGALQLVAQEKELKGGPVFFSVRIAVTGKKETPPLAESLEALGREETVRRLKETALGLQKLS